MVELGPPGAVLLHADLTGGEASSSRSRGKGGRSRPLRAKGTSTKAISAHIGAITGIMAIHNHVQLPFHHIIAATSW